MCVSGRDAEFFQKERRGLEKDVPELERQYENDREKLKVDFEKILTEMQNHIGYMKEEVKTMEKEYMRNKSERNVTFLWYGKKHVHYPFLPSYRTHILVCSVWLCL